MSIHSYNKRRCGYLVGCVFLLVFNFSWLQEIKAQPIIQVFEVFTLDSMNIDSIRIRGLKGDEELTRVISNPLNDSCGSVELFFRFQGCGSALTRIFDTTFEVSISTNRIIGYSVLDTSANCVYPDSPLVSTLVVEWSSCASISLWESPSIGSVDRIYPIPATNTLMVEVEESPFEYKVYTMDGILIENGLSDSKEAEIKVTGVSPGIYVIEIKDKIGSRFRIFERGR